MNRNRIVVLVILSVAGLIWIIDRIQARSGEFPELHGITLGGVIDKLGEPDQHWDYTMGTSLGGEFRVELFNTYHPDDPETQDVEIKELWWNRTNWLGRKWYITVWFHQVNGQWVALETCWWDDRVVF